MERVLARILTIEMKAKTGITFHDRVADRPDNWRLAFKSEADKEFTNGMISISK